MDNGGISGRMRLEYAGPMVDHYTDNVITANEQPQSVCCRPSGLNGAKAAEAAIQIWAGWVRHQHTRLALVGDRGHPRKAYILVTAILSPGALQLN